MTPPNPDALAGVVARVERAIAGKPSSGMALVPVDCVAALLAALAEARSQNARMLHAINWACGAGDSDFEEPEGAKRYWWRKPLHDKAGLAYDRERCEYVLPPRTPTTETA